MPEHKSTRRVFLRQGVAGGAAAGAALSGLTALSYGRVIGANDRISVGLIGCGGRGRYIVSQMLKPADGNATVTAVCDIWKSRLAPYPAEIQSLFGAPPAACHDYRQMLDKPGVDAVIIATPDHQHCGQTIDAVRAGKHVYVEKPVAALAEDLPELNRCLDAVKASKAVVQHGTHGVSCPAVRAVKQLIAEGRLGRLFRVEGTETAAVPYWMHYQGPKTQDDTNWEAFLYNRPHRPFDPLMHARWMGYYFITSSTIGGWMTHFSNFVHFVTGCAAPVTGTAWGGAYAPTNDRRCDGPDQVTVVLDYAEGFHTHFTSHFGSAIDNERVVFMFEKGSVRTRFGHHIGNPTVSSEGVNDDIKPHQLLDFEPPYPGAAHVKNWLDCIRSGESPNADMEFGYRQGIAMAVGDLACKLGCKVMFDPPARQVRPVDAAARRA